MAVVMLSGGAMSCTIQDDDVPGALDIRTFFPTKVVPGLEVTIYGSGFNDVEEVIFLEEDAIGSSTASKAATGHNGTSAAGNDTATKAASGHNDVSTTSFRRAGDGTMWVTVPEGISEKGGRIALRAKNGTAKSTAKSTTNTTKSSNNTSTTATKTTTKTTQTAVSSQTFTVGKTEVTGYSFQAGDKVTRGGQVSVFGTDLEFVSGVRLWDREDGTPVVLGSGDFTRQGSRSIVITLPERSADCTFAGVISTIDGRQFTMPELFYDLSAYPGQWETEKTLIWENADPDGNGPALWNNIYRFAPENHTSGEEISAIPKDTWERMKTGPFYMLARLEAEWQCIRVTTGWWDPGWNVGDISTGSDRIISLDDGTFILELNFADDATFTSALDRRHLLLTGQGYTPLQLYFAREVWAGGGDGPHEIAIWENADPAGNGPALWNGRYRFAPESNSTGEEIFTVPQDDWRRMKTRPFYILASQDANWYCVRVTTGWWDPSWNVGDLQTGDERIVPADNGTFCICLDFTEDATFTSALDYKHLLFTGQGYTPLRLYFLE